MAASLFFLSMLGLHTRRSHQNKTQKIKDLVYPAAFSVGMKVTDELWRVVKRKHQESGAQESLLSFFRAELIPYLNSALHACADDPISDNTDVAFVSWNCLSSKRLQLLQERAHYVSTNQTQKASKTEAEIEQLITDNNDQPEKPIMAYIVF